MSATSADAAKANKSVQTFTTALVVGSAVAGIELLVFILIRNRFKKIYAPRTYLVAPSKQVEPLPHGLLSWIPAILRADAKQIIAKNGLDAYVFVRFLWLMVELFFPVWILTWIVLIPVDIVSSQGTNTGLDRFTFGNVGQTEQPRYAAHLIIAWIITFYVFYLLKREFGAFVVLRQDFLISKEHSRLAQSKTVLVTGVAKEYLNTESLTKFCSVLPGGVKRVWLVRNLGNLPDVHERRDKACAKLESAETNLLKAAAKAIKKNKVENAPTAEELSADPSLMSRYVAPKARPHHKLGFLGLFGKKVDSIEWAREEIATTNKELDEARVVLSGAGANDKYPAESAAFVQFNTQIAAHMFAQCLAHHAPLRMSGRYLEVAQENVIWSNLSINPYQAKARYAISWAMTIGLIVLWSFPVAFVGLLSNISALCLQVSWLAWLCKIPTPLNGIIQGILPPVALAVLFILLPIILRLFARFQGIPLKTSIELSLMTRFFLFLVIHGFLIVTLASGLVAAIPQIAANPGSAVTLLATQLPAASTFFLTYFVTSSLAAAAGGLLRIVPLIIYYVKLYILGSTPRAVYGIKFSMGGVAWGTLFPNMTLLTVIGLSYSVIAPLISGFAFLAFVLFWFVYKYLFLWVLDVPASSETGGLFYPKALSHIFVGLYIEEVCLTGLFFLAQDADGKQSAIPQGALMIVLIVITVFFQLTMSSGYQPLNSYLPLSFAGKISAIQSDVSTPLLGPEESRPSSDEKKGTRFPPPSRDDDGEGLISAAASKSGGQEKAETGTLPGEEHVHKHAFDHPATYVEQPTIWLPEDSAGLHRGEVDVIREAGIDVSTDGAAMSPEGKVDVFRSPPGEDWSEDQRL